MRKSSKDFFESIGEFQHNIGIYLTYTLDAQVIDKLTEYSNGTIFVLHDYTQGKNLEFNRGSGIRCLPVNTLKPNLQNCFHAKLALLKSSEKAKLIIGSMNLSKNSFSSEKEIAFEIELAFEDPADMHIYNTVLSFLQKLKDQIPVHSQEVIQIIEKMKYSDHKVKPGEIEFVSNSETDSMFDHLKIYLQKNCLKDKPIGIKIATPFISGKYISFKDIKEISSNVSIYLRNGAKIDAFRNEFRIFQPVNKKRKGFHAKIILIEYENYSVVFLGSTNFTQQGFFQNMYVNANQECGVLLKIDKNNLTHWFDEKYWTQISDFENYKEFEDNSTEFLEDKLSPYAWATKDKYEITTYIYNPYKTQTVYQNKKSIKLFKENEELCLYKTKELKITDKENNIIAFSLSKDDKELIKIVVFEFELFNSICDSNQESIFDTFKGIYSVDPEEVAEAIEREKLSVNVISTKIDITEPPKLEQYYYNVKDLIDKIKSKKYFSDYNYAEIKKRVSDYEGGSAIYLLLHILKIFKKKTNSDRFVKLCEERIFKLCEDLNISKTQLKKFIVKWQE